MPRSTKLRFEGENRTRSTFRELDRSMGSLGSKTVTLGKNLRRLGGALIAFKGAQLARGAIADAAAFGDLSTQLNFTVEDLSTYSAVARQAGITNETFATSVQRVGRRASEAEKGNKTLAKAFRELNIDATKFKNLGLEGQLLVLADRFTNMADENDRTRVAMQLLDVEGVRLLRFLTSGAQALKTNADEVRRWAEVSGDAARAAQTMGSNIEQLKTTTSTWTSTIFEALSGFALWVIEQKKAQLGLNKINTDLELQAKTFGVLNSDINDFNVALDSMTGHNDGVRALTESVAALPRALEIAGKGKPFADIEQDMRSLNNQMNTFALGLGGFENLKIDPFADEETANQRIAIPIENAIRAGGERGARGMGEAILNEAKTNVIRQLAGLLAGSIGGSGGGGFGGFIKGLLGGSAASGNPNVSAGRIYRTHGLGSREFFIPNQSGSIQTAGGGGGGGGMTVNVDARGADAGVEMRVRKAVEQAVAASRADRADQRARRR